MRRAQRNEDITTGKSNETNSPEAPDSHDKTVLPRIFWAMKYIILPSIGFAVVYWCCFLFVALGISPLEPPWYLSGLRILIGSPFLAFLLGTFIFSFNISHAQEVFKSTRYSLSNAFRRALRTFLVSLALSLVTILSLFGTAFVMSRTVSYRSYLFIMKIGVGIAIIAYALILSSFSSPNPSEHFFLCVARVEFWVIILALTALLANVLALLVSVTITELWQYYPPEEALARWLPSVLQYSLPLVIIIPLYPLLLSYFGNKDLPH